jgi:hypothetical protein
VTPQRGADGEHRYRVVFDDGETRREVGGCEACGRIHCPLADMDRPVPPQDAATGPVAVEQLDAELTRKFAALTEDAATGQGAREAQIAADNARGRAHTCCPTPGCQGCWCSRPRAAGADSRGRVERWDMVEAVAAELERLVAACCIRHETPGGAVDVSHGHRDLHTLAPLAQRLRAALAAVPGPEQQP